LPSLIKRHDLQSTKVMKFFQSPRARLFIYWSPEKRCRFNICAFCAVSLRKLFASVGALREPRSKPTSFPGSLSSTREAESTGATLDQSMVVHCFILIMINIPGGLLYKRTVVLAEILKRTPKRH